MIVFGLSHKTAPIAVRERAAVAPSRHDQVLAEIAGIDAVAEAMLLSTCNRVEVYAVAKAGAKAESVQDGIRKLLVQLAGAAVVPHLRGCSGPEALRHLFRVASSLDSLVVGEPQILGQFKEAIRKAHDFGCLGSTLQAHTDAALKLAKRVRSETAIGQGQVSVSTVAVQLALRIFENLKGRQALMVGAGEMAEGAARLIVRHGADVTVVNRHIERGARLAAGIGGKAKSWEQLEQALVEADIVIASTGSRHPVITKKLLSGIRRRRRGRSLFLIDIAVPRDVEPEVNELDNVYLYDIDDLSMVVSQSLSHRRQHADRGEELVREQLRRTLQRNSQAAIKPVIIGLRRHAENVFEAEMTRSLRGRLKHLDGEEREALAAMMQAAVNKLLHAPTRQLKSLADEPEGARLAASLLRAFEIEVDGVENAQAVPLRAAESVSRDAASGDEETPGAGPQNRALAT